MPSKKSLRILSFTGLLLLLIYFMVEHSESMSAGLGVNESNENGSPTGQTVVTTQPVKMRAKLKERPQLPDTAKPDAKVDEEIENIKQEVGIKEDIGEKIPKAHSATVDAHFDPAKEYQMILVSSPMVIFSKSYCPFSKRLKELLHQKYVFTPNFIVVELDKHEHGAELQSYIGSQTGRTTVPNVVINGVSRGGFDDLRVLQENGELLTSLKDWAGKMLTVSKKEKPSNN
ncbi:LADA_0F05732g1_1 [Lachancea dasiensis]|uniref:LADA_0F05732g1_1 n=1 Tax=Lachancea dasiensis TaxID=1072105 RepID=A0A1G4JJV8_9SACH|nr:LADA_0F05732g1_1 [Lachancea dasiensis]